MQSNIRVGVTIYDAVKINTQIEDDNFLYSAPTLLTINIMIMDEFDLFSQEIDSELVTEDIDNIDPFSEDKFEYEEYDDGGILYE